MRNFPLASLWGGGKEIAADILAQQEHRPWSLPVRPWYMFQSWQDLLFAHWPIPASAIEKLLPPA